MAFKMKGSAFKLNNVATKSALKDTKSWGADPKTGAWDSDWSEKDSHNKKHKSNPDWDHEKEKKDATVKIAKKLGKVAKKAIGRKGEMEGKPLEMKSPAKHTGSATHPTGAITAHKGHGSMKKTFRDLKPPTKP